MEEEEEASERKRLDEDPTTKVAPLRAKITADRRQAIAVSRIVGARLRSRFTHTKKKKKKKGATKIRFISTRSHLSTRAFGINYSFLFPVPSEAQETVSRGTEERERERERRREWKLQASHSSVQAERNCESEHSGLPRGWSRDFAQTCTSRPAGRTATVDSAEEDVRTDSAGFTNLSSFGREGQFQWPN
jgi:hypothetical protein